MHYGHVCCKNARLQGFKKWGVKTHELPCAYFRIFFAKKF